MQMAPEEPSPKLLNILSGHYREGSAYSTLRPKGSDSWLLIHTAEGSGRIGPMRASPGDWTLFRPRVFQDYGTAEAHWELVWCHFHPRPHWLPWLAWTELPNGVLHESLPDRPELIGLFLSCQECARLQDPHAEALAMNRLEELLLRISMVRQRYDPDLDARVQSAIQSITKNVAAPHSIHSLAQAVGLSSSRFSHLFRQHTGETPGEFLERTRMERAASLLRTSDEPIQTVAGLVGYESPFYFTLRFKKRTGMSPTEYRMRRG